MVAADEEEADDEDEEVDGLQGAADEDDARHDASLSFCRSVLAGLPRPLHPTMDDDEANGEGDEESLSSDVGRRPDGKPDRLTPSHADGSLRRPTSLGSCPRRRSERCGSVDLADQLWALWAGRRHHAQHLKTAVWSAAISANQRRPRA